MNIEELQTLTGDRYQIEGFLTQGGMGVIYTARHHSLGSRVAIKVLPTEVASSAVRLARFKREAALAANLSHPNIVPVYEFDATPELAYLVMPFIEGKTFADELAEHGKLDDATVRRMIHQVGAALGFAHEREVVHRDVKPANILKEEATGRWLVTDFGIAHVSDTVDSTHTDITQTGTVIGTPAYMSPEQRWGGRVDGRSDLYSLAAVAYQAICGTATEQLPDKLLETRSEIERAMHNAQPKIKPEVARALSWPLELKMEDRPKVAEEWLNALEKAEGTRARLWWAWAAGAAAVVIASLLFLLGERPATGEPAVPTLAVFPFTGNLSGDASYLKTAAPQAFDWELQGLGPNYLVIGPTELQQEITRRHGNEIPDANQLVDIARSLNVTTALLGRTELQGDSLTIDLQLHDVASGDVTSFSETASIDSFSSLVDGIVEKVVGSLASETTGWPNAIPEGGVEGYRTYFQADRDLREGRYQAAVRGFDEVIGNDSTFAPAYFKRMLARVFAGRPSQYSTWLRSGLEAATAYREELDPWSQQLLGGYEALLVDGDLGLADSIARDLVERNPQAETNFLLGYVQFNFGPVLPNTPRREAAVRFRRAVEKDPRFAMALWHLAVIAMLEEDEAVRRYLDDFLAVDSVSFWAEMAVMADSVLFGEGLPNIPESINRLSPGALEIVSQTLAELDPPSNSRPVAQEALRVLWNRAEDPSDKRLAFRMRMAVRLARARFAGTDSLLQEGLRVRVPQDELDRWMVLSAITPLPELGSESELNEAVRRLETGSANDAEATWLLARWHMEQGSPMAGRAILNLERIAGDPDLTSPQARSLMQDVEAVQNLASGDTTKALGLWDEATQYYSVDDFKFGLTASLWPLRLRRTEILVQQGRYETALDVIGTFERMFGFVDQVAWPTILNLKAEAALATGDPARVPEALAAYRRLERLLEDANGARGRALLQEATSKKVEQPGN
jgi:tetratricopeptide (TPR) repeat protein